MGIKNIRELLKNCKDGIVPKNLNNYSGQKIAIDYSNTIYKFMYRTQKNGNGNTWNFLEHVIDLISCLRKNNITPIIVFDTKSPDFKLNELEKRENRKQNNTIKMKKIITDIKTKDPDVIKSNNFNQQLKEIKDLSYDITKVKNLDKTTWINISQVNKLSTQVIKPTQLHYACSAALFRYLGIPYIRSEYEADDMCGYLYKKGFVNACMSEDTDLLAHGVGILLRNVNTYNGSLIEYNLNKIINNLELKSHSEFLDVCILTGTDYYKIKGLGPMGAYRLIKNYKTIENPKLLLELKNRYKIDLIEFNYNRLRHIFNHYMNSPIYEEKVNNMPHGFELGSPRLDRLFPFLMKTCKKIMTEEEVYDILNLNSN